MNKFNYDREIEVATELGRAAGAILLAHYHSPFLVEQKINALQEMEEVTAADRESNDLIVRRLAAEFPDDGILAEESVDTEERLNKELNWRREISGQQSSPMHGSHIWISPPTLCRPLG